MFASLNGWHWLILGILLFICEALGVGGILVGAAVAAILTAGVLAIVPLTWQVQFVIFGVLALIATMIFWKFFRVPQLDNETSKLNNKMARLVGMRASLLVEVKAGRGKVQIQDALWTVACESDIPVGTIVEVTGYDDSVLHVTPIGQPDMASPQS